MNWYKQQSKIQKEAWNWDKAQKGFWAGIALGLAGWLGLSQVELNNMRNQLGNDDQALAQALDEEVRDHGGDPQQILQQNPSEVSANPDGTEIVQRAPTRPTPEEEQAAANPEEGPDFVDLYMDRMAEREGFRNQVYDDGVGVWTIGIGHAMDDGNGGHVERSQRAFQQVFGNSVNWNDVRNGRVSLTDEQVRQLAAYDIDDKANVAREMFNDFDTFPPYLQEALLDSVYRGDTGQRTTALINQGRWREAAVEYLNRRDYIDAVNNRPDPRTGRLMRGIIPRMEHNRDAMLRYAEELGQ